MLSTLWIFVLLNIIFRDIHDLFKPGFLEEMMTGSVNGTQVIEEALLLGGIMIEIPIFMFLLSQVLKYNLNRWANIIIGAIGIAFVISTDTKDMDDIFFATIEVLSLSIIVWCTWKLHKPKASID